MIDEIQYVTNIQGDRVGVLLTVEAYQRFQQQCQIEDPKLLLNLSLEELQVLADCKLVPEEQAQIDQTLERNALRQLSDSEVARLDTVLKKVEYLNRLRSRAKYTLQELEKLP
jgi:hypothetical protein